MCYPRPFPYIAYRFVTPDGQGTRFTYRLDADLSKAWFFRVLRPVLMPRNQKTLFAGNISGLIQSLPASISNSQAISLTCPTVFWMLRELPSGIEALGFGLALTQGPPRLDVTVIYCEKKINQRHGGFVIAWTPPACCQRRGHCFALWGGLCRLSTGHQNE